MPRRPKRIIVLGGKLLWELTVHEIVEAAVNPGRVPYDLGDCADFINNQRLLAAFADADKDDTEGLLDRFHVAMGADYSREFEALRLGEALRFGLEHRLVERAGAYPTPCWRLLQRERQFECVGPANRQRAIRVRGVQGPEAVIAARLWDRELKRRAKARGREVEKFRPFIDYALNEICRRAPDTPLPDYLAKLAVGEHNTIAACRQLIIDEFEDGESGPYRMEMALMKIVRRLPDEEPRPPRISSADDAVLGDLWL